MYSPSARLYGTVIEVSNRSRSETSDWNSHPGRALHGWLQFPNEYRPGRSSCPKQVTFSTLLTSTSKYLSNADSVNAPEEGAIARRTKPPPRFPEIQPTLTRSPAWTVCRKELVGSNASQGASVFPGLPVAIFTDGGHLCYCKCTIGRRGAGH